MLVLLLCAVCGVLRPLKLKAQGWKNKGVFVRACKTYRWAGVVVGSWFLLVIPAGIVVVRITIHSAICSSLFFYSFDRLSWRIVFSKQRKRIQT